MIFATTKQRILQYIEYKGIDRKVFFQNTGIKRGLLDADKLQATVSDVYIAKILATYPDINPDWLLTGQGSMLRIITPELPQTVTQSQNDDIIALLKEQLEKKDKKIEEQAQEIGMLKSDNRKLLEQVMGLGLPEGKLSTSPSQSKDAPSVTAHL